MRLFPDGASDAAWKLFEEAFKVFIIESSHAESCSSNEQRNSLGRSFGFFPSPLFSHPSFQQPTRKTRYELRIFWLSSNFLTSDSLREEYSVKQSLDPTPITGVCSNYASQMLFPAPGSAGSPLLTHKASLSPVSSPLCSDLGCSAALHSRWNFWSLFKALSQWTNGLHFFLKRSETLH